MIHVVRRLPVRVQIALLVLSVLGLGAGAFLLLQ